MIDLKFLRENPDAVRTSQRTRGEDPALVDAVAAYRSRFQPSEQLAEPYVIAAVNVITSDDADDAARQLEAARRSRVRGMLGRGRDREFTEQELDALMASPAAAQVLNMTRYTGGGTPDTVVDYLERFADHADADELMISPIATRQADVLRSLDLLATAWGLPAPRAAAAVPGV